MWGTILGNDYYKNGTCNLRRKKKKKRRGRRRRTFYSQISLIKYKNISSLDLTRNVISIILHIQYAFGLVSRSPRPTFHLFFFFFWSVFSWDPQTSFFNYFFIKNESHNTIYTFKNYFVTVFSVFSIQQNKQYLNGPSV